MISAVLPENKLNFLKFQVHIKHATHNHPANTSIFVSKRLYSKLKMAMLQSSESVPEIIRRVLSMNNEEAAIAKLPTFETLCNSMRKFRAKVQQARANQATDPSVFSVFSVDPRLSSTNNDLYNASSAEESFGINIDGLNLSNIAEFNSGSAGTRFDEPSKFLLYTLIIQFIREFIPVYRIYSMIKQRSFIHNSYQLRKQKSFIIYNKEESKRLRIEWFCGLLLNLER